MPRCSDTFLAVTIAFATLWFAVSSETKCSATSTPPGDYTAVSGRIMSDTDGYGWTHYTGLDNCTWTVTCPAGKHFAVVSLKYKLKKYLAKIDFVNITDLSSNVLLKSFVGSSSQGYLFTTARAVRVNFLSVEAWDENGFTLDYACLSFQCTARSAAGLLAERETLTNRSGRILSDMDGRNPNVLLMPNETCLFSIQCPAATPSLAVHRNVALTGDSQLTIGTTKYQGRSIGWTFYDKSTDFDSTSAATESKTSGDDGFTLDYACNPTKCTSNASGMTFTSSDGFFDTDVDGNFNSVKYAAGEKCDWTINCPAEMRTVVVGMAGYIGSGTNVTIVADPPQASTFSVPHGMFTKAWATTLPAAAQLIAKFESANETTSSDWGVSFTYGCRSNMCGSSLAGATQTAPSGSLTPGLKSRDRSSYPGIQYPFLSFAGETCEWTVSCPAGYRNGISLVGSAVVDRIEVTDVDTGRTLINGTSIPLTFFSSINIRVNYHSTTARTRYEEMLTYQCISHPNCTSPNATSIASASGTLTTDLDGSEDEYKTPRGVQCAWNVTCPAGKQGYFVMRDSGTFDGEYSVTSPDGKREYLAPIDSGRTFGDSQYIQASAVQLRAVRENTGSAVNGADLDFICSERMCPVLNGFNFTTASGAFQTDPSQKRYTRDVLPGMSCSWGIICPPGYGFVTFASDSYLKAADVIFRVYDTVTGEELANLVETDASTRFPTDVRRVDVAKGTNLNIVYDANTKFKTTGVVSTSFECQRSSCPSTGNEVVASNGTLQSLFDTTANERGYCTQRIECPAKEGYVAMRVSYGLMMSPVNFTIGDVSMPEHISSELKVETVLVKTSADGSVDIVYNTMAALASGYTINFMCMAEPCSSFESNMTLEGSLMSFGMGTAVTSPVITEKCTWNLKCPASQPFLAAAVSFGDMEGNDNTGEFAVTDVASKSKIADIKSAFEDFAFSRNAVEGVVLTADAPLEVEVDASCSMCSSGGSQFIEDPDDLVIKSSSFLGERCFWHLRCTNGARVMATSIGGDVGANALNAYVASNGAKQRQLDPATMPLIASFAGVLSDFTFHFNESDVFLQFNATEASSGFSLTASCDDRGPCTATTRSVDEATGTVTITRTGAWRSWPSTCLESIQCPPGKPTAIIGMDVDLLSLTVSVIGNIGVKKASQDSVQAITFSRETTTTYRGVISSPGLVQIYRSNIAAGGLDKAVVNYTCVERSICTSPIASGTTIDPPSCSYGAQCSPTQLTTDGDGEERCAWSMKCPPGQLLKLGVVGADKDHILRLDPTTTFRAGLTSFGPSTALKHQDRTWLFDSSNGTMSFSLDASVTWDPVPTASCWPGKCDADDTAWRKEPSGTIYLGGSATAMYSIYAECSFIIQCPAGYTSLEVVVDGKFNTNRDVIYFDTLQASSTKSTGYRVVKESVERTYVVGPWTNPHINEQKVTFDDTSFVRMRFAATADGYQNTSGTHATYTCTGFSPVATPLPQSTPPPTPQPAVTPPPSPAPGSPVTTTTVPIITPSPGTPNSPSTTGQPPSPSSGPISTPVPTSTRASVPTPQPQGPSPWPPTTPQPSTPTPLNGAPPSSDSGGDGSYVGGIVGGVVGGIVIVGAISGGLVVLAKKGVLGGAAAPEGFATADVLDDKFVHSSPEASEMLQLTTPSDGNIL